MSAATLTARSSIYRSRPSALAPGSRPCDPRRVSGALARPATTVLVLLVLAGSAAAFAISEGLKVQKAAITAVHVGKVISPDCNCPTDRAGIGFRLTRSDRLTLSILDSEGVSVRTLIASKLFSRGKHHFTWNGRTAVGAVVPEGTYEPRIRLHRAGKTLVLPNPIRVDTTPPRIAVVSVHPRVISPDGDGRSDVLHVRYRIDERAHALLYVNGVLRARTKFERTRDTVDWYGKVGGEALPPGTYRLALAAVDLAGNRSRPIGAGTVTIRYIDLSPKSLHAAPRARVVVDVSTDALRVHYLVRRGRTVVESGSSPRPLVFRAPAKPDRYVLVVSTAGHSAQAALIVRKP
jgi:FlgD Ig-like domain